MFGIVILSLPPNDDLVYCICLSKGFVLPVEIVKDRTVHFLEDFEASGGRLLFPLLEVFKIDLRLDCVGQAFGCHLSST